MMQMQQQVVLRRRSRWLVALPALLAGCYAYVPSAVTPAPGTVLAFELTDRGRVGVADSLGPEVLVVEGTVVSATDSAYVMKVSAVETLRGRRAKWSGEQVTIRREYVNRVSERRISKQRTALVAGSAAAAVIGFIVTRDLVGGGGGGEGNGGGGGGGQTYRGVP